MVSLSKPALADLIRPLEAVHAEAVANVLENADRLLQIYDQLDESLSTTPERVDIGIVSQSAAMPGFEVRTRQESAALSVAALTSYPVNVNGQKLVFLSPESTHRNTDRHSSILVSRLCATVKRSCTCILSKRQILQDQIEHLLVFLHLIPQRLDVRRGT